MLNSSKNKYFWAACIIGFGLTYLGYSEYGKPKYLDGRLIPDPIAPISRDSGSTDYTLIDWIFPDKKYFEHWVLRFPDNATISRPEDLKLRGPTIINGVKLSNDQRNHRLTVYLRMPDMAFLPKGQERFHPDVAYVSVNAGHQIYKRTIHNFYGQIETGFSGRYNRLNCAKDKQIAENFFLMRDETALEKEAHGPSYKSYLQDKCGLLRNYVHFAHYDHADNLLAKGECRTDDLYKSEHLSCNFRVWLPQQRDAYVRIAPKYLQQFPRIYRKIVKILSDATVIEHSVNLQWRPGISPPAQAESIGKSTASSHDSVAKTTDSTAEEKADEKQSNAVLFTIPGCEIPQVGKKDKLILLGAYGASALSNVTILGQEKETKAAELSIEEGTEPLYIIISSYKGVIWNVVGATDRISNIVLTSFVGSNKGIVGSGVVGIDRSKVSFLAESQRCIRYFGSTKVPEAAQAVGSVRALAGRDPDYVVGVNEIGFASLPNGPVEKLTRLHRPSIIDRELLRFSPSGVMRLDPDDVVSETPAELYEVLPQEAGLAQLLTEGKIERVDRDYRIKEKIRFPAGLNGGHSVRFVLSRGVPKPDGDPGHSCVYSESTGLWNKKRCR